MTPLRLVTAQGSATAIELELMRGSHTYDLDPLAAGPSNLYPISRHEQDDDEDDESNIELNEEPIRIAKRELEDMMDPDEWDWIESTDSIYSQTAQVVALPDSPTLTTLATLTTLVDPVNLPLPEPPVPVERLAELIPLPESPTLVNFVDPKYAPLPESPVPVELSGLELIPLPESPLSETVNRELIQVLASTTLDASSTPRLAPLKNSHLPEVPEFSLVIEPLTPRLIPLPDSPINPVFSFIATASTSQAHSRSSTRKTYYDEVGVPLHNLSIGNRFAFNPNIGSPADIKSLFVISHFDVDDNTVRPTSPQEVKFSVPKSSSSELAKTQDDDCDILFQPAPQKERLTCRPGNIVSLAGQGPKTPSIPRSRDINGNTAGLSHAWEQKAGEQKYAPIRFYGLVKNADAVIQPQQDFKENLTPHLDEVAKHKISFHTLVKNADSIKSGNDQKVLKGRPALLNLTEATYSFQARVDRKVEKVMKLIDEGVEETACDEILNMLREW